MMGMMMFWMILFWIAVLGGGAWLALTLIHREDPARTRAVIAPSIVVVGAVALAVLVAVPAIVMATNGWDMRGMHGGGRNTAGDPAVRRDSDAAVRIEDYAFLPGNLEIPAGASVTWTNKDSVPHDGTARGGAWKTARLSRNESDTLTFETPGEYDYYCTIHPSMKARLVVRPGNTGAS